MVLINEEFHRTLYLMTENRFLVEHLERLKNGIFALRYNAYITLGIPQISISQHEGIVRALEEGDLNKLKQSIRDNIIYPKMLHEAKRAATPSAQGARELVEGLLLATREGT